jgi:hypothetical protein
MAHAYRMQDNLGLDTLIIIIIIMLKKGGLSVLPVP